MFFKIKGNIYCWGFFAIFLCIKSSAKQIDIDLTGVSYHIGANASLQAHTKAPRKLDRNAAFVFNPGIGAGIDFRENSRAPYWYGFSPTIKALFVRDCDDRSMYFLNFGIRYRYMLNHSISLDLNAATMLVNAEKWITGKRKYAINPFASSGINYHLKNYDATIGMVLSVIPKNKKSGNPDINSFNIMFMSFYASLPIS